ncbi:MAG TPA: 4Fe-4S dicluster domain-containing protein, partial [Burkholderiales bacterium]|nr:4Fe-4S dicluster domain-containing protein [Burkholderiales bacterium]
EQVCKYMCPYARFQSAMFDKDTLIITYDAARGEPRGKKAGAGDCVDCGICVQVSPTGIDIRNGLQYECIGCAACIDGCNQVMDKLGRPAGLIRYTTTHALEQKLSRRDIFRRVLRPRVLVYSGILLAVGIAFLASLYLKTPLKVDVIRDRAAISREVEGGMIENVYRLQVMNTTERPRTFEITATAPRDAAGGVANIEIWGEAMVIVPATENRVALVKVRGRAQPGTHPIEFRIRAVGFDGVEVREKSVFLVR